MKKAVFFDIDGTLAVGKTIPDSAQKALRMLRENGTLVWICTGRSYSYVKAFFGSYADGFIASNGRYGVMNDTVLYDCPLKEEEISYFKNTVLDHGGACQFFGQDRGFFFGNDQFYETAAQPWQEGFLRKGEEITVPVYNFDVTFCDREHMLRLQKSLEDKCILNPHGPHMTADVTIKGFDKGTAVTAIAGKLGIERNDTYAFGDGLNDICMLEAVGHAVAMGNGQDSVKAAAEYVTTDILEDGVYNGLRHYNLI